MTIRLTLRSLAAAILLLMAAAPGGASDLQTPLVTGTDGVDTFFCFLENAGIRPLDVNKVALVSANGETLCQAGSFTIPPRSGGEICGAVSGRAPARCVFDIKSVEAQIRANLCLFNNGRCVSRTDAQGNAVEPPVQRLTGEVAARR